MARIRIIKPMDLMHHGITVNYLARDGGEMDSLEIHLAQVVVRLTTGELEYINQEVARARANAN